MWTRSILVLSCAAGIAAAQDAPPPGPVIRIDVNLVQLDAVVTDAKGTHVPNLKIEDFRILQAGKEQVISNLSYITAGPSPRPLIAKAGAPKGDRALPPPPPVTLKPADVQRTFAMVVDDLGLSFESVAHVREALKKFVDQQMQPGDLVAIIRTSGGMGAFQQFTTDKGMLHAAIDRIKFSLFSRVGTFSFLPAGSSNLGTPRMPEVIFRVGTLGAIRYVVEDLSRLPGRKSAILFSESMDLSNQPGSS